MNTTLYINVIILWILSVNPYRGFGYVPVGAMAVITSILPEAHC